jgi:hypothetical protein
MNRDFNLLVCPTTGQPLLPDPQAKRVVSADGSITYPIIDGIIDFVAISYNLIGTPVSDWIGG